MLTPARRQHEDVRREADADEREGFLRVLQQLVDNLGGAR